MRTVHTITTQVRSQKHNFLRPYCCILQCFFLPECIIQVLFVRFKYTQMYTCNYYRIQLQSTCVVGCIRCGIDKDYIFVQYPGSLVVSCLAITAQPMNVYLAVYNKIILQQTIFTNMPCKMVIQIHLEITANTYIISKHDTPPIQILFPHHSNH
mgnify:FL=1